MLTYLFSGKITEIIPEPAAQAGIASQAVHPIDALRQVAEAEFEHLTARETHDLASAAEQYRVSRGRHPPPGFDEWFRFAQAKDAVIVEEFFDRIYQDLSPFWAIEPRELRRRARSIPTRIIVRNHRATLETDENRSWMDIWHDLVATIEDRLPDLDMPINVMDETRLVVPWETINELVNDEQSRRKFPDADQAVAEYMSLSESDGETPPYDPGFAVPGEGGYWAMARVGCPGASPSHHSRVDHVDFGDPPWELGSFQRLSFRGYIQNFTLAKDICIRPELQALHGSFIEPISVSTSHNLLPLFGGSKLSINNEILLPPAMYWADNDWYSGGRNKHGGQWESKYDKVVWRGSATGGRAREPIWTGFHRHRLLSMLNATSVKDAQANGSHGLNFRLPYYVHDDDDLPKFVAEHTDTGFVHLVCSPYVEADPHCPYTDPYFAVVPGMPMKDMYNFKYLPDIDGNSFSGRYRGFLLSTSLPIKATVYNEWHDSRLFPWVHFVPMDISYFDVYGILQYFLRGRDHVARRIALAGKSWAERVLRREDMQIYTYRLLLEYARICDDRREMLGYVDR